MAADSELTSIRANLLQRLKAGESCRLVLGPCPSELFTEKELMLKAVELNAYAVEYLPEELIRDPEVWLKAVQQNFYSLRQCLGFLHVEPSSLQFLPCPADVLRDKAFAKQLLFINASTLRFLAPELRGDREVVGWALQKSGLALEFASAELRADGDVVRKAVQKDGLALEFADSALLQEEDLALEAIRSNTAAIRLLPEALSRSMSFLLQAAAAGGGSILRFVAPEFASDKVFVQHIIKHDCTVLAHAPPELQEDPELILTAIAAGGAQGSAALELAPGSLRDNRRFMLRAAAITPQALRLAPDRLRNDRSFVIEAVQRRGAALQFAPFEFRADPEVVMEAVKQDLGALAFADAPLRQDDKFREEVRYLQKAVEVT